MRLAAAFIALLALSGPAFAADSAGSPPDAATTAKVDKPRFAKWYCLKAGEELFDVTFQERGFRVNNITVTEGDAPLSQRPAVILSASAANREGGAIAVTLEYIRFSGDVPDVAISARPMMYSVGPGKTEEVSGYALTTRKLAPADRECVRATAFLY